MNTALAMKSPRIKKPKQIVIEWIDDILDRKRWNATELARKCELAPSTLLRLLNNPEHPFLPSQRTLSKIAEGSGIPIPKKVLDAIGADPEETEVGDVIMRRSSRSRYNMVEFRHVSTLPASLQAATSGPNKESHVPSVPQIEGDETAFAFNVPDDSMGYWLKAGSLCYATKSRDPICGDLILMTGKDGKTKIRFLVGLDESGIRLTKDMSSQEEDKVAFDDIAEIAIVVVIVRAV